jgi:phosphate transport system substrate-binding protein
MRKNLFVVFAALVVASMLLSACGPAATPEPTVAPTEAATEEPTAEPTADPMAMYAPDAVSGAIISAGSSTVFPLSERMKQRFEEEGFSGTLTVDSIGSGAGIERFCKAGETDIANSSRKIRDTEIESCKALAASRTPVEFLVGIDALSVVVSKENDFVTDVTLAELAQIFSTAEKWSDVRAEWPAENILRFSPGTDSGTFDYFVEAVMAPANQVDGANNIPAGEEAILESTNTQFSEDDNVLVQGVQGSKFAIGYFGYAYYQENAAELTALSVDGIVPTAATAEDNSYPISRPLFIYSDAKIMTDKPQVAAFIHFYITNVKDEILDVGYFPVSDARAQTNLDAWMAATGMK